MKRTGVLLTVLLVLGTSACGGGALSEPAAGSPGPALVVERFLRAANANDLETMTQLFGSSTQNIVQLDGQSKAERRMYALASLLRHDDFRILGQEAVPGRMREATELRVELKQGNQEVVVPHLVVRKRSGGWIIERIDIERLTQSD